MKTKFFSRIAQLLFHRDDPALAATTLTANAAAGATTVTVASAAGLADGNTFRVGDGSQCEWNKVSGAPAGNVVTLAWPLGKAHLSGESARRGITYDLGDPVAEGVDVQIGVGSTDVSVATRRTVFAIVRDYVSASIAGQWPTFTLPQLAAALGMLASRVTGAGTIASPYQLITDGSEFGEDINLGILVTGKLADGTDFFAEFHGVDMDYTVVQANLRQGAVGAIPFRGVPSSQVIFGTTIPTYTVTSQRPTKGNMFNLPSEFGVYQNAGGGLNSTLSAAAAAGAVAFNVVASTGGAAGDPVMFGSGDAMEIHRLASVGAGTMNTRTPVRAAQASGTAVVEQTQVPFGGPTEEGLTFSIGGSVREVPLANERTKGIIPGDATMSMSFMLGSIQLPNVAYALGIPQSAISGGRLPANANIGTQDLDRVYFKGLNAAGATIEIAGFGCSQDLSQFALKLSTRDVAKIPLTFRPVTLQFQQYQ